MRIVVDMPSENKSSQKLANKNRSRSSNNLIKKRERTLEKKANENVNAPSATAHKRNRAMGAESAEAGKAAGYNQSESSMFLADSSDEEESSVINAEGTPSEEPDNQVYMDDENTVGSEDYKYDEEEEEEDEDDFFIEDEKDQLRRKTRSSKSRKEGQRPSKNQKSNARRRHVKKTTRPYMAGDDEDLFATVATKPSPFSIIVSVIETIVLSGIFGVVGYQAASVIFSNIVKGVVGG